MKLESYQQLEETLLVIAERLNENAYEKFVDGELSGQELENLYARIRRWAIESEQMLELAEPR